MPTRSPVGSGRSNTLALALALACPVTLGLAACGGPLTSSSSHARAESSEADATAAKLAASLSGAQRAPAERARDAYRHPTETLGFFGLREDMHVVEVAPGAGWYTAVLAPVLRDRGHLSVTASARPGPLDARMAKDPSTFGKVERLVQPEHGFSLGPAESQDLVLTFRNLHNWIPDGSDATFFAAAYSALKHGGTLGLVDHRAKPGTDPKTSGETGYVPEDYAIAAATKAGFRLVAKSEINANPKDTKDHPKGVWTLPPVLELGDQDRAKYEAIGESDRMTLKFVKP